MADSKSTPLANLNNKRSDDSQVVNDILSKYNNLQENPDGTMPPVNPNIPKMEQEFESRDMNDQLYNMNSDNTQYKEHSANEQRRLKKSNHEEEYEEQEDDDDEEYDEYEIEELPLWKKIVNELRVPLFIFLMIIAIMSTTPNKMIANYLPLFKEGENNALNTMGFLFKAFLCSIVSYLLVRFIRV